MISHNILIISAGLMALSVFACSLSARLGVPALLLFLFIGMLAGSDGIGKIEFQDVQLTQLLGIVSLILILFDGGIGSRWREIKPIAKEGVLLSTLGVFLTSSLIGAFTHYIFGMPWLHGLLLGAIISSTDAAAVFSVLRTRKIGLHSDLKHLLEFESGFNDPMAVFLTISLISLIQHPDQSPWLLFPYFIRQMGFGLLIGWGLAQALLHFLQRFPLENEGITPVLTISFAILTYGIADLAGGSGFLAVYILALFIGNDEFLHKRYVTRFHDGIAWLMQIVMFLLLGLLVNPNQLTAVIGIGLSITGFSIFLARPLGTLLSMAIFKRGLRQKLFISWVGLRGAVPIVLATFPFSAGLPMANDIFNIVFFVVLASVLIQGSSIEWVAKFLGVLRPFDDKPKYPLEFSPTRHTHNDLIEVTIPKHSPLANKLLAELGLPPGVLVVMVYRDNEFIVPNGALALQEGDNMLVMAGQKQLRQLQDLIDYTR
jgi:potassium/hydrogen antiporter